MNGSYLTPEDFEQIMGSSTFPESQQALLLQLQAAEAMRGQQPEMRQNGRVGVAANPLEFIAATIKDQRSNRMSRDALAQQKALIEELRKARAAYGRNVMAPQQAPSQVPYDLSQTGQM